MEVIVLKIFSSVIVECARAHNTLLQMPVTSAIIILKTNTHANNNIPLVEEIKYMRSGRRDGDDDVVDVVVVSCRVITMNSTLAAFHEA